MNNKPEIQEIKVRLHHIRHGESVEIWQSESINGRYQYFGRDLHGAHAWSVVVDAPNGYCEKSHGTDDNIHFIICDQNWNELFRDGNDMQLYGNGFPSLRTTILNEWDKIKSTHPGVTSEGFSDWVLKGSGMVPDSVDELNWRSMWKSRIRTEELSRFQWAGDDYAVVRILMQHDKCSKRWYEYFGMYMGNIPHKDFSHWIGYKYGIDLNKYK